MDNEKRELLRAQLMPLLEKLYLEGYRDTTRRASGASASAHATFNKVVRVLDQQMLEAQLTDELSAFYERRKKPKMPDKQTSYISLCPHCYCMTRTVSGEFKTQCGKCGGDKDAK